MRMITLIILVGTTACSAARALPESYSAFLKDDGHTWCAYKDPAEFQSAVETIKPTESARMTYVSSTPAEITYQVEAESADWIVIDRYILVKEEVLLKRANLMAQQNLQVIQETTIHAGQAEAFHIVSVTRLDGTNADLPRVDFPSVPVSTDPLSLPFVPVIAEMRSRDIGKLCK